MTLLTREQIESFEIEEILCEGYKIWAVSESELESLKRLALWALDAKSCLEFIDKPNHKEPDEYTTSAYFQFRAFECLKKLGGT